MKKLFTFMLELVPNRRWFAIIINVIALGALTASTITAYLGNLILYVAIDAFAVGLLATSTAVMLMMPGVFRGIAEGEAAVIRAQLEKQFHAAYSDFISEHPEMRDVIKPTIVRQ